MALWQVSTVDTNVFPNDVLLEGLSNATSGQRDFVLWRKMGTPAAIDHTIAYAFILEDFPISDLRTLQSLDGKIRAYNWSSAGWISNGGDQRLNVFVGKVVSK